VVKNMMDRILGHYPFLRAADVGIKKLHPAMPGDVHHSFVQLCYSAEDINKN
jgi:dihydroneopterin aldolase